MKTLVLLSIMSIVRPPAPNTLPGGFDPNQATGEVLAVVSGTVGAPISYTFGVWLPRDAAIARSSSIGVITDGRRFIDPNGNKQALYTVTYTPAAAGLHYLNFSSVAIPEQLTDTRTVVIEVKDIPNQPVIFIPGQVAQVDPAYDYALAKTDPIEHQKAVKATQRWWYLQGIPTEQWLYNVRF